MWFFHSFPETTSRNGPALSLESPCLPAVGRCRCHRLRQWLRGRGPAAAGAQRWRLGVPAAMDPSWIRHGQLMQFTLQHLPSNMTETCPLQHLQ